jgi:hypothetical protein
VDSVSSRWHEKTWNIGFFWEGDLEKDRKRQETGDLKEGSIRCNMKKIARKRKVTRVLILTYPG